MGSTSRHGPSMPKSSHNNPLSMPHSEFSIQRKEKMVGTDGTADGKRKITESHRIHLRVWVR